MQFKEIAKGTRKVVATRNDDNSEWQSRLYVNNGETATLTNAKHKTLKGVEKWAAKVLAR